MVLPPWSSRESPGMTIVRHIRFCSMHPPGWQALFSLSPAPPHFPLIAAFFFPPERFFFQKKYRPCICSSAAALYCRRYRHQRSTFKRYCLFTGFLLPLLTTFSTFTAAFLVSFLSASAIILFLLCFLSRNAGSLCQLAHRQCGSASNAAFISQYLLFFRMQHNINSAGRGALFGMRNGLQKPSSCYFISAVSSFYTACFSAPYFQFCPRGLPPYLPAITAGRPSSLFSLRVIYPFFSSWPPSLPNILQHFCA